MYIRMWPVDNDADALRVSGDGQPLSHSSLTPNSHASNICQMTGSNITSQEKLTWIPNHKNVPR